MTKTLTVHYTPDLHPDRRTPDPHQDAFSRTTLGFWMYLMTDCLVFACLFCTYAILHNNTFGGPTTKDIFNLPLAFTETMILLLSSVTCGFGILNAVKDNKNRVIVWLAASFLLGLSFVVIEFTEFSDLVAEGNSWQRSAFLTSYFSLVGTHGTHVSVGLLWMIVIMAQVMISGITIDTFRRLVVFSLFWHFLDLVWIFIFTFVYLFGVI